MIGGDIDRSMEAQTVGWVEPTGRREAPPNDRLRETRRRIDCK